MENSPIDQPQRLGVAWVLRQAAIVAVLALTAIHLTGVVCLARAEQRISRAATASASEAMLPAASLRSVCDQALRNLEKQGFDSRCASIAVRCNGQKLVARPRAGDEIHVTVSIPCRDTLPTTVARLAPWLATEDVVGEATVVMP